MVCKAIFYFIVIFCLVLIGKGIQCNKYHTGPDPWNFEDDDHLSQVGEDNSIPPDLRIYPKKKAKESEISYGIGEWFYRRLLSIVLNNGAVKNEDGTVDISIQMKLDQNRWETLNEYLKSSSPLSEDKLRRSLGYIEQSIYEPSMPIKLILAWSEYIQIYLTEYKTEITWTLTMLAASGLAFWIWTHMSHRRAIILLLILLYAYEVVVSYKEAEQEEIKTFVAALNQCKGFFWSSNCELPKPNPLIFLKHMNPLKIGVRMFTTIVSEPMIALSSTVKIMTQGITDGLWYPFDAIFYGILITFFNILLLFFLIMIVFNFILNIPFNFNVFGIFNVGLLQRNRNVFGEANNQNHQPAPPSVENQNVNNNAIDNKVIHRLLDVVAQVLDNRPNHHAQNSLEFRQINVPNRPNLAQNNMEFREIDLPNPVINVAPAPSLRRSASTGKLPNFRLYNNNTNIGQIRRRNVPVDIDAGGDAR